MKNLPTLHDDSSFAVQFSISVSKTKAITIIAVYDKDYQIIWTPRKHTRDVIRWIPSDNPAKISHNYA